MRIVHLQTVPTVCVLWCFRCFGAVRFIHILQYQFIGTRSKRLLNEVTMKNMGESMIWNPKHWWYNKTFRNHLCLQFTARKWSTTSMCAFLMGNVVWLFCAAFFGILCVIETVSCWGGDWQIQSFEIELLDTAHQVVAAPLFYARDELDKFISDHTSGLFKHGR